MSRVIKAVLIDPYKEEVTDVEYDASNYKNIYPLLRCDIFTMIKLADEDDLFIDDEGLLKVNDETKFFMHDAYPQPLAGYGLIVGADEDTGDSVAVHHDAAYYRPRIRFLDVAMVQVFGYFK